MLAFSTLNFQFSILNSQFLIFPCIILSFLISFQLFQILIKIKALARKTYKQIALPEKIFRECDVMLKHATSKGLAVPPALVRDFVTIHSRTDELAPLKVRHQDFLSSEKTDFSDMDINVMSNVHFELSRIVAPATPYTLLFLQTDAANSFGRFQIFGSAPLLRRMLFIAISCLLILLSFAYIPGGREMIEGPLLANQESALLLAVMFRLAAAGLGASFYALYKAKKYVANNTFNPSYEGTYWTEFVLGLMAGLIFSTLLDGQNTGASVGGTVMMGKIAVALLGGFSSTVVYEFMNRTVTSLSSIFKPDVSKVLEVEVKNIRADVENVFAQKKQTILNHLSDLQSDIFSGDFNKDGIGARIKGLIGDLTETDNTGYVPQTTKVVNRPKPTPNPTNPNIPDDVPTEGNVEINIDDVDPMSVSAIHADDLNEATEDEYVSIFDTRA